MARKPIIRVTEGPRKDSEFAVEDGFVIGRSEECEINTGDNTTSRRHAQISVEKDGYRVVDLDSANGMWVNKRKLKSHYLNHGDEITLGDTTLKVEFVVDAKAQRRNFMVFLLVIVVIGGVGLFYAWQTGQQQLARAASVDLNLTKEVESATLGYSVTVDPQMDMNVTDFVRHKWLKSNGEPDPDKLWGADYPEVGNGFLGDKAVIREYERMSFLTVMDGTYLEFLRFTVDAMGGLPRFGNLLNYPLNDESLPNSERVTIDERNIQEFDHPEYGTFEQALTTIPTSQVDPSGRTVNFLYIQRCYVVGTRRWVVSAVTNASMVGYNATTGDFSGRAGDAIEALFDGFRINVEAASPTVSRTDSELRDAALKAIADAEVLETGSPNLNNRYRALLFYCEAARLAGMMSTEVVAYGDAMGRVRGQRNHLTDALRRRRDEIRNKMNVQQYQEALLQADELEAVTDTTDHPFPPWFEDEWGRWSAPAREDLNFKMNAARRMR